MTLSIIIGVIVLAILAIVGSSIYYWPESYANDPAKFDRSFTAEEQAKISSVTITAEELADATCETGHECWIAVDQVVYDVSTIPSWAKGVHHGISAGHDQTEAFFKSGHGVSSLEKLAVVGSYPSGVSAPSADTTSTP